MNKYKRLPDGVGYFNNFFFFLQLIDWLTLTHYWLTFKEF